MTTKKISEFDEVTSLDDSDILPAVRTSEPTIALRNKKITYKNLKTTLGANFTDISLTMPPKTLAPNTYAYVDAAAVGYVSGNLIQSSVAYIADGIEIKVISSNTNDSVKVFYRNISSSSVTIPIHAIKVRFFN